MITLDNISKRFENSWIFKNISYSFADGSRYAVLGNNGSGKSTLLRCIAGIHAVNKGSITYTINGQPVAPENFYPHYSFCAPGMDIIEEMTLEEFLKFHFSFKPALPGYTVTDVIREIELKHFAGQQIRNFSSGMKQRVKLGQALFSHTPVVFLDEPCTNLDKKGIDLYQHLLALTTTAERTIIIASNDPREYPAADHILDMNILSHSDKLTVG